jgi:hypothetical protein
LVGTSCFAGQMYYCLCGNLKPVKNDKIFFQSKQDLSHCVSRQREGLTKKIGASGNTSGLYVTCLFKIRWPPRRKRRSAAARLLGLRVRVLTGSWMSVSCEGCVLTGRGLCNGTIPRREESHRLWCVWVWSTNLNNEEA